MQRIYYYILAFLMLAFLVAGCSNNMDNSISNSSSATVNIQLSTTIADNSESITKSSLASSSNTISLNNNTQLISAVNEDNSSLTKTSTTANLLKNGVTYRINVYKGAVSTSNWIASQQFTVGQSTAGTFTLPSSGTYYFICYSLNNTTNLTADGATTTSIASISDTTDLLYTRDTLTISDTPSSYTLGITFSHLFSRVRVKLSSQIGNITNIGNFNVSPDYSSASLDLLNGSLTYNNSSTTKSISFSNTTPNDTTATSGYSLVCTPATNSASLTISTLTAGGKTITSQILTNYNIQPGKSYTWTLNLKEDTSGQVILGGVTWARGNLLYNSSTGVYSFASRADIYGDYWFPGYLKPKLLETTDQYNQDPNRNPDLSINGGTGDPCTKVYPENTWRLPTLTEIQNLKTSSDVQNPSTWAPYRTSQAYITSASSNSGMFFFTYSDPGDARTSYLFLPYAGAYYAQETINANGSSGFYIASNGNSYANLQVGSGSLWPSVNYYTAPNHAISIRCVKSSS